MEIQSQNSMNGMISKNIVSLITSYPELQEAEHIDNLAQIYSLSFIKTFDAQMNEINTTPITKEDYDNFVD